MSNTPNKSLNHRIKRRRALVAGAAAISLAGCGLAPQASMVTPEQQEADRQVKKYQADIEFALDNVDRDRLRAAAERRAAALAGVPVASSPLSPETTPVITSTEPLATPPTASVTSAHTPSAGAALSATGSVILASATDPGHASPLNPPRAAAAVARTGTTPPHPAAPAALAPPAQAAPAVLTPPPAHPAPAAHVAPMAPPASSTPAPAPAVARAEPSVARAEPAIATAHDPTPPSSPTASPMSGVVVSPLVSGPTEIPAAVITPFSLPPTPAVAAMGAMTAMATPGQTAAPESPAADPAVPSFDQALAIVKDNISEHPSLNTALAVALLDGGKAVEVFSKLSGADQKVASDLLRALEAMKAPSESPTLADRTGPLRDAARRWQQDADLALPRLVLATRVDSFGVFTPISGTFEQGKRHTVIIYCEVGNFASTKGDDGWFTTRLAQQETLVTDDGLLVWRPNAEEVEDRSMNQRHDFYLVKKLTIPETLAAGKYTLRMSVTDRHTNKIAVVSMPIEITMK